jgi:hypothetical protein
MATVVRKKIVKEAGQPVDELEEQVAQVRLCLNAAGAVSRRCEALLFLPRDSEYDIYSVCLYI